MDTSAGEISVVERLNRFVHGCKQNTLMYTTTLTTALHTTHAGKMGRKIAKDETHTHPFNGPFSGTTRVSRYQKRKPIWILLKQEIVSGSDISWAICKSAPRSRQIAMPVPHHSSFFTGGMPFRLPNQQCHSTEGKKLKCGTI